MKATNTTSILETLISLLERQARELADEWVLDGTTFEQDQHVRLAALSLYEAAIHLRSLRSADWRDKKKRKPKK